ncbi:AAA family ATPase [Elizabethkingia anophelis]|nr:AAA family ATPase [Elizabethkingia anophelis]MCT4175486.1 AAA family ATPase [Elizabethkingia anophelis]
MSNIGSFWSKWDLHIHTPASIIEHYGKDNATVWDDYIADLNNLPDNISVLGINDYLFLDGYKTVKKYFDEGKLPKIKKIFPVIELRLKIFGNQSKNDAWHRINFHVIFSDELDAEVIEAQFISGLQSHYNLLPENQSYWNGVLTKQSLEDFGKMIIQHSTAEIKNPALEVGFNSLNFTEEGVFNLLKNKYFKDKYLTAIGKTEWEKLRWDGSIAEKLSIINSVDFIFSACENVEAYNNSETSLKAQLKSFNLLDCSDAHHFSSSLEKDRIGNFNQWIKAEPTFEGLKQLKYEPKYRKVVSENEPIKPHRTIDSIRFSFPENTLLKNLQTNTEQLFCLRDLKEEIFFSPYFTCIIGGRGSGKSTIINLIAQQLGEKSDFFEDNKIMVEKKDILKNDGKEYITISGTNEIEFISQGKVEELSSGNRLTDLIFNERIKAVGNDYVEKEKLLKAKLILIDEKIKGITELEVLRANVSTKKVSLENDKKIVASIENDTYKDLSKKVKETTEKIESINRNKEKYSEFFETLTELCLAIDIENSSDEYSSRLIEIVDYIDKLDEITRLKDENGIGYKTSLKTFPDTDTLLEDKKAELATFKQQIVDYFTSIGSTPDSIADVDRATFNIATIAKEIEELEKKMLQKAEQIKKLNEQIAGLKEMANECEQIIIRRLEAINKDLDISNDNVEKISFKYDFSWEKYRNRLYQTFKEHFQHYHKTGLSWDNVAGCLDHITPDESFLNLNYEQFLEQVEQKSFDRNLLYVKVFSEIFDSQYNFIIYKSMIKKNLYSVSENVQITGYYGKLPLTSCSFGQRCTAVVVTLLMTGVKPLLIDEPEAHLDNRLIAEYLVDLIKEKKNERQIIFATHNANFVVNGDSELIHILEIPKEKVFTEIISTTIEDLSNRKSLLKLEGGEEAFKKRDRKLLSGFVS